MITKMKRIFFISTLCLVLMASIILANDSKNNFGNEEYHMVSIVSANDSNNIFKNEEYHYSIEMPTEWFLIFNSEKKDFLALNAQEHMALNLQVTKLGQTISIDFENPQTDAFITKLIKEERKNLKMNLESLEKKEVAGKKAVFITFNNDLEYCYYYVFCDEQILYEIAGCGELTRQHEGLRTLDNIVSTFKFIPTQ